MSIRLSIKDHIFNIQVFFYYFTFKLKAQSACVSPAVGSRILSKRLGALLGATGFSLDLITQGSTMTKSIEVLIPKPTIQIRSKALQVAILTIIIGWVISPLLSFSIGLII